MPVATKCFIINIFSFFLRFCAGGPDGTPRADKVGLEPTASGFEDPRSTIELFVLLRWGARSAPPLYQDALTTPGSRPLETKSRIIIRESLKKLYTPLGLPVKTHRLRTLTLDPFFLSLDNLIEAANLFVVEKSDTFFCILFNAIL